MVRKAALIAIGLLALPASAQTTNTQCRWIGTIWSCESQPSGVQIPAPLDHGAILRSGAAVVPPYQPVPRQPPIPAPPPVNATQRYGISPDSRRFVELALIYCRTGAPIADLPEDQQAISGALCYAYDQGRIAENAGDRR